MPIKKYTYDALDRLIADQLGNLPIVQFGYDANGTAATVLANRAYHADGLLRTQTFGNGFSETRDYDTQGRLVQQTLPSLAAAATPVSSVVIAPNKPTPQLAGTVITFTAQASGGSGSYQYRPDAGMCSFAPTATLETRLDRELRHGQCEREHDNPRAREGATISARTRARTTSRLACSGR